jgi:superfamily II DNA or RNA helicase
MEWLAHQTKAVEQLQAKFNDSDTVILRMKVGSGKTRCILEFIKHKTLYVCPKNVCGHIVDEARKWKNIVPQIIKSSNDDISSNFVIISYSLLSRMRRTHAILNVKWDLVILDEIHTILKMTKARSIIANELQRETTLGLTATLNTFHNSHKVLARMIHGGHEVVDICCDQDSVRRYDTHYHVLELTPEQRLNYNNLLKGDTTTEEDTKQNDLVDDLMKTFTKTVVSEEKTEEKVFFDRPRTVKLSSTDISVMDALMLQPEKKIKKKKKKRDGLSAYQNCQSADKFTSILKVPHIMEFLNANCTEIQKIVIVSEHAKPLLELSMILTCQFARIMPNVKSVTARTKELHRFKDDHNVRVLLATTKLINTGIDLGFVDVMILVNAPGNVNGIQQIIGRLTREGQSPKTLERPCVVFVNFKDTIASNILRQNLEQIQ